MNAQKTKPTKSALTFLVVDDDSGARQIVVDYLKSFGYENIIESENGSEAINILRSHKVDFVISDWEMPEASGIELLSALKSDPAFNHVPFIMVTSPISEERGKVEEAAASKVDAYIIKPFRSEVLRTKIEGALAASQMLGRRGVLVVDDDLEVRATMVEYLNQMGHTPIFEASDGEQGFRLLKENKSEIAFVISDWEMPNLPGIDLLKLIRADEELRNIPFIMVTSQSSIERLKIQQAIEAHVDNYLLKPFRGDDLRAKVESVLLKARAMAGIQRDLKIANEHLSSGRWIDATKAFNLVLAQDPNHVESYLGLAMATRHLAPEKAIPKATQFIRKAISIDPRCEAAYIDLALIFESAMSIDKAIACLKEALEQCAFSAYIHYHLGRLQLRRGQQNEGIKELRKALELKPDFKEAEELLSGRSE